MSQITNYDNGGATYTYDGGGNRVRKDASGAWTEYVYFDGQPMAEKNSDGSWSDYIFANGQRIAQADSYDERIHMEGTTTVAGAYAAWYVPFPSYTIKAGDKISWRQYQAGAVGGIGISFGGGGSTNWTTTDTDGQVMNSDNTQNQWHFRTVDLSPFAGKAVANVWIAADAATPVGSWNGWFSDIAVYSADGTVTPIYNREPSEGLSYFSLAGISNATAAAERSNTADDAIQPANSTTYYVGDQINSTRMLMAAGGWPLSSDTYYPYGSEASPSGDANHYKFTGKERDYASGLDYFGARYYSSNMGRFMSPDWSRNPQGVPYADFSNPQSLNLYTYVMNNPMTRIDLDGHLDCSGTNAGGIGCQTQAAWQAEDNGQATSVDAYMQQHAAPQQTSNSTSNGSGFLSHVSNLFHGHSWNYGMREYSTVTFSYPSADSSGPNNPYVAYGATAVGAVGAVVGGRMGDVLGPASNIISAWNDRSPLNLTVSSLSFLPGAGEPSALLGVDTALINLEVQTAGQGMINAIPGEEGDPVAQNGVQVSMYQDCENAGYCN